MKHVMTITVITTADGAVEAHAWDAAGLGVVGTGESVPAALIELAYGINTFAGDTMSALEDLTKEMVSLDGDFARVLGECLPGHGREKPRREE